MPNKRGRPMMLPDKQQIVTKVSGDMAESLNALVALTGETPASVLRRGLALVLAEAGLWNLATRTPITPSPTNARKEHP